MRIIRRYLFREILIMTGLVMSVLLGLAVFIEFVTQLDDVGTGDYGIPQALLFAVLNLPNLAHVMLPMAVLLGALLGLGRLANQSELVVIRSAGVSQLRLAGAVTTTGVVLGLITLVLGQNVGPPLENYARQIRAQAKHADSGVATGSSAWVLDGSTIMNVTTPNADDESGGVYVFRMDVPGRLASIGRADSAGIGDSNEWLLSNLAETSFESDGVTTRLHDVWTEPSNLSPDLVGLAVVRPENLTGLALFRYARYLRSNGLDSTLYDVAFWGRIASAVAVIPMCVLALPFVFGRLRSSGAGARMLVGLVIGLAYFLASRGLADGGQVYGLSASVVAWTPTIALSMVTGVAVARAR